MKEKDINALKCLIEAHKSAGVKIIKLERPIEMSEADAKALTEFIAEKREDEKEIFKKIEKGEI